MFDLERKNLVYKSEQKEKTLPPKVIKIINILFIILAIVFLLGFFKTGFLGMSSSQSFGAFIIFICFFIICTIYLSFVDALRQNFSVKSSLADRLSLEKMKDINLAEYLDFRMVRAIVRALKYCQKKKRGLNTFVVVYYFWQDSRGKEIFAKLGLDQDLFEEKLKIEMKKSVEMDIDEKQFLSILKKAVIYAMSNFHKNVEVRDFLVAAGEEDQNFINILSNAEMGFEDVDHVAAWEDYVENEI
ncbi:MAG: hypothetical protein Q8N98_00135, partial [bacterium]|nr:hypothetical protein [bacterium]